MDQASDIMLDQQNLINMHQDKIEHLSKKVDVLQGFIQAINQISAKMKVVDALNYEVRDI